ncbi:MAG: DUF4194 domain-containing protein [Gammaproteobacteria bacterium]|nr:DUF4194 domain-containing protein [Gammaproteobacteria bacterium]
MNDSSIPSDNAIQSAPVLIHLLRGVLYRDQHELLWQALSESQVTVRAYLAVIGLDLVVDEAEGYAFLRQRQTDPDQEQVALPRLVPRRPLSYPVSLLCVLLRKRLVEQDAGGGETRVVLSREQIVDMMRVFLPLKGNEAKTVDQINRHINKVIELGFLRPLHGQENQFEVRRILKALVNADWLAELEDKLSQYRAHAASIND